MHKSSLAEAQELQARTSRPRLLQLDALRGLAAVTVVNSHLWLVFKDSLPPQTVEIFAAGRSAVILFFVLSGYVLSLPFWNQKALPYGPYLVRRFCRIYLPFAAAAALSIACAAYFRNSHPPLSSWFNQTWHTPVTPALVAQQFLMVPLNEFNTSFWSLTYEMQMSVVMPLLCFLMIRTNPALAALGFAAVVFTWPMDPYGTPQYPALSYQIVFLFVLGATLARYQDFLAKACGRLGGWLWLVLLVSGYFYYDFILYATQGTRLAQWLGLRIFLIGGLASAGILLCSLHLEPFARVLKHSLPEYLGRISYSLYLVHGIVIFAGFHLLYGHMRTRWLVPLIVVACFAAGHVFCLAIEEPAMRLGKKLVQGRRRAVSNAGAVVAQ